MPDETPFVRCVVINFDGGQMTIDCLESLLASDWPADRLEIVMVDNGSVDDVVERVRAELPAVRVIEPLANTGFAGGCNLGIRAPGPFDFIALVNNDATVAPDWLGPLVDVFDDDDRLGAACPKIVFEGRYAEAELEVPNASKIGIDPRTLGVRLTGARFDGQRADERLAFDEGFFNQEAPDREAGEELSRWSWKHGRVRVRAVDGEIPARLALRVTAPEPRDVRLRTVRGTDAVEALGPEPVWLEVDLDPEPFDVINNVGSSLYPHGFGGDRGFLERDHGQFEGPTDVFAWCGGAVLLSKPYLDDVGLFDEQLFLYYEDTDLSWRGRLRGWRYRYVPTSLVRHRHAASSGVGSDVFRYYTERNRPLVLVKNAPPGLALSEGAGMVRRALVTCARDLALRPLTLRMPVRKEALHQWRLLRGYLRLVPSMLRARRAPGRVVERSAMMSWTQTKETAR